MTVQQKFTLIVLILFVVGYIVLQGKRNNERRDVSIEQTETLKFGHTLSERQQIMVEVMDNQEHEDSIISAKYHVGEGKKQSRATYDNYLNEFDRVCNSDEVGIAAQYNLTKAQLDSIKDEAVLQGWHR
jgi:hypothetical protein